MMTNNSKDLLAKLLASENLMILRAPVRTASFDVESRTLTLPQWKDMSESVEEMLIGHEVGHALFTTNEYIKQEGYTHSFHGYMNVCEDVRIEKKIKNKYPGLRRTFIQGYKELNQKDFFDLQGRDLSKLLLIDRINLYYKCGINCGVRFTPAEMDLVRKVEMTDTMADVLAVAQEIYAFTKEERKKFRQQMKEDRLKLNLDSEDAQEELEEALDLLGEEQGDEDDWDTSPIDDEELDEDELDDFEEKQGKGAGDPYKEEEKPEPVPEPTEDEEITSHTDEAFYRRVEEYADTNTQVRTYEPVLADNIFDDTVIGYKRVLAELEVERKVRDEKWFYDHTTGVVNKDAVKKHYEKSQKNVDSFKNETSRVVNYLVKEFEMRKSATQYKRTQTAKIGQLDTRKLAVYQLTDDLFRRIHVVPDAKNHGMLFLLDWSGSMTECIDDTIKQVISLAMFCQRAMIPYQVFAFSSDYDKAKRSDHTTRINLYEVNKAEQNKNKFRGCESFNLIEFFNNKMSTSEFNRMVQFMLDQPYRYGSSYGMGGTPLNEALLYMIETQISKFLKTNNVEKFSLITLTDGQGSSLNTLGGSIQESDYNYETHKSIKVKNYMRDPITRKEYALGRYNHTPVLLNIIRDRFNCSVVGFHVLRNSKRILEQFCHDNLGRADNTPGEYTGRRLLVDEMRVELRKEGFYSLTGTGHDELFLVSIAKLEIQEGDLAVKADMKATAIAKQFEKYMNVKKTSRILLNRFIGLVA
jgi:uncharacterized membrane protein